MNQKGFTLIEMMVVLMIISILLLVTIPNVTKNNAVVKETGCKALIKLIEAQVQAYEIDTGELPASMDALVTEGYVKTTECPGGQAITYTNGEVTGPSGYE